MPEKYCPTPHNVLILNKNTRHTPGKNETISIEHPADEFDTPYLNSDDNIFNIPELCIDVPGTYFFI